MQRGDSVRLVKVAHTLKGSAANLGAGEMVRICAELQVLGEAENIGIAASLVAISKASSSRCATRSCPRETAG